MENKVKQLYKIIAPWCDIQRKIYRLYTKMSNNHKKGWKILAQYFCYRIEKKFRCRISPGAVIGVGLNLPHPEGVVIGEKAKIGKNATIYQQVTIGQNQGGYPIIGDNVIIYAGAKIIGNIHIGYNSVIGANAVVTKDVPANSIWGGIPAKEITKRDVKKEYY